ncbi:MAG: head-tail adaptor protein [bacterium]
MLARLLRHNISIYKPSKNTSEYGTIKYDYNLDYSTKAQVKYSGGGEQSENDRQVVNKVLTFLIRKRKDKAINESYRIKFEDNFYDIKEIIQNYDGVFKSLEIKAEKVNE